MTDRIHIGYETMVARLKRVQDLLGRERAFDILKQHGGVKSVRELHPRKYPAVIYQAEFALANAFAWEKLIAARDFARRYHNSNALNHVVTMPHYNAAIDDWFDACDKELKLMNMGLYNDRGEPL